MRFRMREIACENCQGTQKARSSRYYLPYLRMNIMNICTLIVHCTQAIACVQVHTYLYIYIYTYTYTHAHTGATSLAHTYIYMNIF